MTDAANENMQEWSPEKLLTRALEAWRTSFDPALGQLIREFGRTLTVEPIAKKTSFLDAWFERVAEARPEDLSLLCSTLGEKKYRHPAKRLKALKKLPLDPRITYGALTVLGAYREDAAKEALSVFRQYKKDPWTSETVLRVKSDGKGRRKPYGKEVHALFDALKWSAPKVKPASDEVKAVREELRRRTSPEAYRERREAKKPEADVSSLLDAAINNPTDVEVLGVLADRLDEQGDPRGRFINLQLARGTTGRPSKEERALLKQYEKQWLGPQHYKFAAKGQVFELGMLVEANIKADITDLPVARSLRTIHWQRSGRGNGFSEATAPRLRTLTGLRPSLSEDRAVIGHAALTNLEVVARASAAGVLECCAQGAKFPQVARLSLRRATVTTPMERAHALMDAVGTFPSLTTLDLGRKSVASIIAELPRWISIRAERALEALTLTPAKEVTDDRKVLGFIVELRSKSAVLRCTSRTPDATIAGRYLEALKSHGLTEFTIDAGAKWASSPPPELNLADAKTTFV